MWTYRLEEWFEGDVSEADWLAGWTRDGWEPWLKDGAWSDIGGVWRRRWNLRRWTE